MVDSWRAKGAGIHLLLGHTILDIKEDDGVTFITADGSEFWMGHNQDCCESVGLEDKDADWDVLIGSPVLFAEEVDSGDLGPLNKYDDSYTWTFYKIGTNKGSMTMRWYGTSNGYYSESVDFYKVK